MKAGAPRLRDSRSAHTGGDLAQPVGVRVARSAGEV